MRVLLSSLAGVVAGPLSAQFVEPVCVTHTWNGSQLGESFGWVSAPLRDIDGDGAMEVAITAPGRSGNRGRVSIRSGRTGRLLRRSVGTVAGARYGHAVRDAGDLDGDGATDYVVGAPGSSTVAGTAEVFSVSASLLLTMQQGVAGDQFGYSVAGPGDLDGDGVPDYAVGAPDTNNPGALAGAVYVLSGAGGGVLHVFRGAPGDRLGTAVGAIGDVTGDGRSELVLGAVGAPGGGLAYVYDVGQPAQPLYTLTPDASAASFGQYFADSPGDVNGDGWPDVYVGDFSDSGAGRAAGRAYVFDGRNGQRIWTIAGTTPGGGFGIGRGAGDVDGDGRADLLLCAWQDSSGAPFAGKAWVYSGANLQVLHTFTCNVAGATVGFDAHGMGDVDNDGRQDFLLTGAQLNGSTGVAYLVSGCAAAGRSYGAGLAGAGGTVPQLSLQGCAEPGEAVALAVQGGLASAPGVLLASATAAMTPLAGGQLLVGAGVAWPHRLDAAGTMSLPLTVPNTPAMRGTSTYLQAGYADQAAPLGLSLTAGLRVDVK